MPSGIGRMPTRIDPNDIGQYDEASGVLRLCAPLTPSRNVLDTWRVSRYYRTIRRFREVTLTSLKLQTISALGAGYPRPWAQKIEIRIIRCSDTTRRLDLDNISGGCKLTFDCLQQKFGGNRYWYEGVGIIPNDAEQHVEVGAIENRPVGRWMDLDLGTWLYIKRVK